MNSLWLVALIAGVFLQVLIISRLVAGPYRDFPFLFGYVLSALFSDIAGSAAYFNRGLDADYARHYWIGETIQAVLIFGVVIALIHRILKDRGRPALRMWLVVGVVAAFFSCFYVTRNSALLSTWMTQFSRDLSFCAVLLNLLLWMALIRHQSEDHRLLLISSGLGIQTAGKAIGHSLRQISRTMITPGNLVIVLSSLVCLYIWWNAFRRPDDDTEAKSSFDPVQPEE